MSSNHFIKYRYNISLHNLIESQSILEVPLIDLTPPSDIQNPLLAKRTTTAATVAYYLS